MIDKNLTRASRTNELLRVIAAVSGPALVAGCSLEQGESEWTATTEHELIGGSQAAEYHMRSTVKLASCTGAKVGPRHFLLAAHCVDGDGGKVIANYGPGRSLRVSNSIVLDSTATYQTLTILQTTLHPSWTESCAGSCPAGNARRPLKPADIAVIEVQQETPGIPQAKVDLTAIAPGTWVVKNGYGCEDSLKGDQAGAQRYKTHVTQVVSSDAVLHEGSTIASADEADALGASYLITRGNAASASEACVCSGDSGGPLYRNDNTHLRVVGVNAFYTFPSPNDGISMTDWHTRTSTRSRYNIGAWLKSLGVQTTGGGVNEGAGTISMERWNNVAGTAVSNIPVTRAPSSTGSLTSFELVPNSGDNYGVRVRGYLTAPATGEYSFWIAGNDQASLFLSTDSSAANKRRIAFHVGSTNYREWSKYSSQRSDAIRLTAGQRYYIEALVKEGSGQDNLSVGWLQPTQTGSGPLQVIPGYQLSPF